LKKSGTQVRRENVRNGFARDELRKPASGISFQQVVNFGFSFQADRSE
jgi:hypothetical protein